MVRQRENSHRSNSLLKKRSALGYVSTSSVCNSTGEDAQEGCESEMFPVYARFSLPLPLDFFFFIVFIYGSALKPGHQRYAVEISIGVSRFFFSSILVWISPVSLFPPSKAAHAAE